MAGGFKRADYRSLFGGHCIRRNGDRPLELDLRRRIRRHDITNLPGAAAHQWRLRRGEWGGGHGIA